MWTLTVDGVVSMDLASVVGAHVVIRTASSTAPVAARVNMGGDNGGSNAFIGCLVTLQGEVCCCARRCLPLTARCPR